MSFIYLVVCWFPLNIGYEKNREQGLNICCIHYGNGAQHSIILVVSRSWYQRCAESEKNIWSQIVFVSGAK